jgi:RNA polymerase sigma-54 factor
LALGHRLELRQGQGLVITPQLQQAIKLLQLSNIELDAFVEAELERNPLLQRDEGESEVVSEVEREPASSDLGVDVVAEGSANHEMDATPDDVSPGERATGDGEQAQEAGGQIDWSRAGGGGSFEHDGDYEGALTGIPTLSEHLHRQLTQAALPATEQLVAGVLIDAVDEGGYLRLDLTETAERLGCAQDLIESVLTVLQGFEPTASSPATSASAWPCS